MIEREPFVRYNEKKKDDTFTIKLSKDGNDRAMLNTCKSLIEQPKDSTALKQLAWIGAKVILAEKTRYLIETLFKNRRKNARTGIVEFE